MELRQLQQFQAAGALVRRNRHLNVLDPSLHLRGPRPLQGSRLVLELLRPVAPPPFSSQDGANQEVKAMVHAGHSQVLADIALGDSAGCSYSVSGTVFRRGFGTPQIEDISSEEELSYSDQGDPHSGTALNQLLITVEEQADNYSFPSSVATRVPLWNFAEQTPCGSKTQLKTATTQAQPVTSTPVKHVDPQTQAQAQMRPPAPAQPPRPAPAYFPQPQAAPPPPGG